MNDTCKILYNLRQSQTNENQNLTSQVQFVALKNSDMKNINIICKFRYDFSLMKILDKEVKKKR